MSPLKKSPEPKIHLAADDTSLSRCGKVVSADDIVVAALESDCDICRGTLLVGPVGQKGCEVRPRTNHIPSPIEIGLGRDKD